MIWPTEKAVRTVGLAAECTISVRRRPQPGEVHYQRHGHHVRGQRLRHITGGFGEKSSVEASMIENIAGFLAEWMRRPTLWANVGMIGGILLFISGVHQKKPFYRVFGLVAVGLSLLAGIILFLLYP